MKREILIVDDSFTVRMDLEGALTGVGYGVTSCPTVAAAEAALRSRSFALLILDVILPDGNGIDLLGQLKARPEYAETPVLMLSTEAEVRSRVRGITTGAHEYVGKPYDLSYVLKRVSRLMSAARAPTELPGAERGFGDKSILAVGQRSTFLAVLAERLRLDRHDVILAHSAEEALQLLSVAPVDCILVDSTVPGVDGVAISHRIKGASGREGIPVMLLAARREAGIEERARDAGVDEVVIADGNMTTVRSRLRGLFRKKKLEQGTCSRGAASPAPERPPVKATTTPLLDQVIAASGLTGLLARSSINRACLRVGVDAVSMTAGDLDRALPAIREALLIFMSPEEAAKRVDAMAALARPDGPSPVTRR